MPGDMWMLRRAVANGVSVKFTPEQLRLVYHKVNMELLELWAYHGHE